MDAQPVAPPLRIKILFWIILGAFSVILAEVVSVSSPYAFFDAWGLLAVFPLYTLHSLVLAFLVFRHKRVSITVLFLAGMIFGLYEAYITKVLWNPTWGSPEPMLGGLALVQTAVLVFFWHPWMAFILPLFLAEGFLTGSHEMAAALPPRLSVLTVTRRGKMLLGACFALFCAFYQAMNAPSMALVLLSDLEAGIVLAALLWAWQRMCRGKVYSLRQLLPTGREGLFPAVLLLLNYLWQGILVRPDALPRTWLPHILVWILYGLAGSLLAVHLRRSPVFVPGETIFPHSIPWKGLLLFFAAWAACVFVLTYFKPVALAGILFSWAGGSGLGLFLLARAGWIACRPPVPQSMLQK